MKMTGPMSQKPPAEFRRPRATDRLSHSHPIRFDEAPTAAEAEALRDLMGLIGLRKMRFTGEIIPLRPDGWEVRGTLGASVTQSCVVTLEPVRTRVETDVLLRFVPADKIDSPMDDADFDETLEPLGPEIDLGLIATEALALALPAYPRAEGATLGDINNVDEEIEDQAPNPFAALEALKDKLDKPT
jgi:uncharacterized metal-binding protein YceD (DUF177 family)